MDDLKGQISAMSEYICAGQCEDFVSYARCVARLEAMKLCHEQMGTMLAEDFEE
jgi:hypothetical protein